MFPWKNKQKTKFFTLEKSERFKETKITKEPVQSLTAIILDNELSEESVEI